MPLIAQLVGPAGTGKTTELLRLMTLALQRDIHDPHLIGFCSFTRAARREAASRAADQFNLKPAELETAGWFRTLHSVAYRCLGAGKELLTGNKADREWLANALQEDVEGNPSGFDQDLADPFAGKKTDAGKALALWDVARNRLEPYDAAWQRVDEIEENTPDLILCRAVVERYEQAKRLDGRTDFTDLLTRFAGWYCTPDGAEKCEPDGEAPDLPVWCLDEQQDTGALLHSVCERLIQQPGVRYVYIAGDDGQSIYGWAGSDPHWFRNGWPVAKRRVLPKSYRCPHNIMDLGEAMLRECNDARYYADRNVQGADHAGTIERETIDALTGMVDPREDWLILARTNLLASRLARLLDDADIPWRPTRGNGPWNAPVRNEAIAALMNLQAGAPIDGREWVSILKNIPAKIPAGLLLERGTKTRFEGMTPDAAQDAHPWVPIEELVELGATPLMLDGVKAGRWQEWIDGAEQYAAAVEQFGVEAVNEPRIRVGTIHSAKGAEAENVAVLTSISAACVKAAESDEGFDEEVRVRYVAVTRAKRRLVILDEKKTKFRWKIEA